jgi:D-alanyl-lipoteichoic acid acyltransferase DltB (MBOAT superfamily)
MFFNSIYFLVFLAVTAIVYYAIPQRMKWVLLLIASVFFYLCWTPVHILVLLAVALISYFTARCVYPQNSKIKKKTVCLVAGITLSISFLFICKYADFLAQSCYGILDMFSIAYRRIDLRIALPAGISFFSFKAVSYIMDAYRGKILEKNFLKYFLYVSFFPQVASGPIERSTNLLPELTKEHKFDRQNIQYALFLMLYGYFKKMVVADNLSGIVNRVFGNVSLFSSPVLIGVAFIYSLQILCDFSGYSDIAIGCAKLFGIGTAENFRHPYFSASIPEFWRNWHISLSSWFRDYLYIPLGGNRKGTVRKYLNLLIVFLVSGLWHGAAWNFVFWGFLHAMYQIVGALTATFRAKVATLFHLDKHKKVHKALQVAITFSLVTFAWIFFRANSIADGFYYIKSIFVIDLGGFSLSALIGQIKMLFSVKTVLFSFIVACTCFAVLGWLDYKKDLYQWLCRRNLLVKIIFYALLTCLVLFFASTSTTDFIYARF